MDQTMCRKMERAFRVLLVEDNPVSQAMTVGLLRQFRYEVTCAKHGEEALAILEQGMRFDLILMDCKMPVLDGYDTTAKIREQEECSGKHVPIIALTADASDANLAHCLAVGMDDFIAKPLNRHVLQWMVQQYIAEAALRGKNAA